VGYIYIGSAVVWLLHLVRYLIRREQVLWRIKGNLTLCADDIGINEILLKLMLKYEVILQFLLGKCVLTMKVVESGSR